MQALAYKDLASGGAASPAIAPAITAQAGDVRRPIGHLEHKPDLSHLPGDTSWWQALIGTHQWLTHGKDYIHAQVERYGPVFRGHLIGVPYVGVADPAAVERILRNTDGVWSGALAWRGMTRGFVPRGVTNDIIGAFDLEPHKDVRRLLQPAFSASALESYFNVAIRRIELEIDRWVSVGHVPFKAQVRPLFAGVANEIFLGAMGEADSEFYDRATRDMWRFPYALVRNTWLSPSWRRAMRAYKALKSRLQSQVAERKTRNGSDLFSHLCNSHEQLDWLNEESRIQLMISMMAAAFDTTSSGVTNLGYLLATNPEWQEKLGARARAVRAGSDDSRSLRYQDLSQLPEFEWAWKESLRMYPVVSNVPRVALWDTEVLGHRVPAGALVFPFLAPMMEDPKWWTDPLRFDPERFSPERAEDNRQKGLFMPYGSGAHSCMGGLLSTLQAKAFWYTFLSKARFRLRKPYRPRHEFTPIGLVSGEVELVVEPAS